ncbi:hypothetical protein PG985_003852 [Apiospora marii]|uniref:Uncharacterized protein n=1 Tax=Apiospora marii TaxID=335849 RepID=A0ABR1SI67_9PEZI
MSCLDVPVPGCIRGLLVQEASVSCAESADYKINRRIRAFCENEKHYSSAAIDLACDLASGPSDLIVLVESLPQVLEYNADLATFVRECPMLKAVDELIHFASNGTRSIETVSVLQNIAYPGYDIGVLSMMQADRLVWDIINLKKPKVVLCCWSGVFYEQDFPFLGKVMSKGVGTWPPFEHVEIRDSKILTIRSFRPDITLRRRGKSPNTRMLLIYHFVLAFHLLEDPAGSPRQVPDWAKLMSERASEEQDSDASDLGSEGVVWGIECIPETLIEELALNPRNPSLQGIISCWEPEQQIAFFLKELCHSDYSGGAAPLVRLCLVFQSYEHPDKEEVVKGLHKAGCRQKTFEVEPGIVLKTMSEAARLLDGRLISMLEGEDFVDVQVEWEDMVIVE